jgi:limonene 1,2-monooxygenase
MPCTDLKFGVYLPAFPSIQAKQSEQLKQAIPLVEFLDQLGYDYVWFGENQAARHMQIDELMELISTAADTTQQITLGICISHLHHHDPAELAACLLQLVKLTQGRLALAIEPTVHSHQSSDQAELNAIRETKLEVTRTLVSLLRSKSVSIKSAASDSKHAKSHSAGLSPTPFPVAIASQASPAGARIAGANGLGLISLSATSAGGFNALPASWEVYERIATQEKHPINRACWNLVGPVHIAADRQQAMDNADHGINQWIDDYRRETALDLAAEVKEANISQRLVNNGLAVIGTADDAVEQIRRLSQQSGGFGTFLQMAHSWADQQQTRTSYQLFAEQVMPLFQNSHRNSPADQ